MALGTDHVSAGVGGGATVFVPEIWGQQINDYFRYNLTLASFFIDRSDEISDGGATIYTPNIVAMSSNAKSYNTQVTLNNPIHTRQTLNVSTWQEVSYVIEDREAAQFKKSYHLQQTLAKGGAWEVAVDLETAIAVLFRDFTTHVLGNGTSNVADSSLLAAISLLEAQGTPVYTGETAWIMHPNSFYRQIGSIDKLTLWQNTDSEMPRSKQPTRALYSIPVIVSPAVPLGTGGAEEAGARLNMLAFNDAIHWARLAMPVRSTMGMVGSEGVRVQQSYVHEYLGELITIDMCYGVVENRDNAAVKIRSHSTAVGL
jgi:hypothetical protein